MYFKKYSIYLRSFAEYIYTRFCRMKKTALLVLISGLFWNLNSQTTYRVNIDQPEKLY